MAAGGVGDHQAAGRPGQGDAPCVVQAVVIGTHQDEIVEFGGAAVFPVDQVVGVQAAGGAATGHHTRAVIAVLEGSA
ncbi:hypothetical protein BCA37_05020 [Mycobacterium sp. djl-10]|nr:hypothetical protein BCA37_05020 [Mycobacterium sp. djl-10]